MDKKIRLNMSDENMLKWILELVNQEYNGDLLSLYDKVNAVYGISLC